MFRTQFKQILFTVVCWLLRTFLIVTGTGEDLQLSLLSKEQEKSFSLVIDAREDLHLSLLSKDGFHLGAGEGEQELKELKRVEDSLNDGA